VHFLKYVKKAFLYHWNLLAFAGGMGFALLSGRPDVFAPVVLAGEIAYLGLLSSHPRFQKTVDAQAAADTRGQQTLAAEEALQRMLAGLPPQTVQRFESLRGRCIELRQIATAIRDPHQLNEPPPLEEIHLDGLDRLLWIYLRLLFTQHSLQRFLNQTSEQQIQRDIQNLESRLRALPASEDSQTSRKRKSLEDNLQTSRQRLANYKKARDNSELVHLEIERLENKIRSLSELAINRQEPAFISSQVDQVAASMVQTERTMNELQFATGLEIEEEVPQLVQRQTIKN
jgi:chemotaxis protein histidine kinase CheA